MKNKDGLKRFEEIMVKLIDKAIGQLEQNKKCIEKIISNKPQIAGE